MLSIIIPTKNEEHYLGRTLESITRQQNLPPIEIIVADAQSTDATRAIAESFDCHIIEGGYPAVGRRKGANEAKGDLLLFLDADVVLPDGFIDLNLQEFQKRKLDCATTNYVPLSEKLIDKILFKMYNVFAKATQRIYPLAGGFCILSTRDIYDKVGGWDETIFMGEDLNYVKKCNDQGSFGILKAKPVLYDIRRLEKEGRINLLRKYITGYTYRIFKGEMTTPPFDYVLQGDMNVKTTNPDLNKTINIDTTQSITDENKP